MDDSGDRYDGPARLSAGGSQFDVRVQLRGGFQPIDGRYHWYGRIARDDDLLGRLGTAGATGTLATPEGEAPCRLSDLDPWQRYKVTGISTPPFAAGMTARPAADDAEPSAAGESGAAGPGRSAARDGAAAEPEALAAGDEEGAPAAEGGAAVAEGGAAVAEQRQRGQAGDLPGHVRVAIIGAGFSGLGAGIRLRQAGVTDFVILEKATAVGGTWRDNTYPGCACDVPSHLYSFSFAPNPRWPHSFSRQPDIRQYLEDVTDRYGVREHIRFAAEVTGASWDAGAARWRVDTTRGTLDADILVAAAGPLSEPSFPDIPGLDGFPGEVFHSSRWDHGFRPEGKTVAVVGTGASAIQIIPEIQPRAGRLVLFQRTPAWVMPRMDRPISRTEHWLYSRLPAAQRAARLGIYLGRESNVLGFVRWPRLLHGAQRIAMRNLTRSVSDPALRAKLTPDYVMGCKRVLLSNSYYPALTRPNVDVVAAGLAKIDGSTLTASDGTSYDADAIVFATGFHTIDMPVAARLRGTDGRTLAEVWGDDMRALRGTTVAGFPNLCLIVGPNTGLGHTSMIHIIESQLNYIVDYVTALGRLGAAALHTRPAAQERWCEGVERQMAGTVWITGGCVSWYLNSAGRNPTLWPGSTLRFRHATRRIDLAEYEILPNGRAV